MDDKEKLQKELDKLKKEFDDSQKKSAKVLADLQEKHLADIKELEKKHGEAVEKLTKEIQQRSGTPVTETVAKQMAENQLNDAKPTSTDTLTLGLASATQVSTPGVLPAHHNDVKFEVTDPKKTDMKKGITVISKESAEHFESLGIGKIVK